MEMPTEAEMLPKDKYTVFDRKVKRYRKGIHSESSPMWCCGAVIEGATLRRKHEWTRKRDIRES